MRKMKHFTQLYNFHLTKCSVGRPPTYQYRCYTWKSDKTLYGVLSLQPGATKQEVKDAYIKLSKEFHPDRNKDNREAHQRFTEINEAYSAIMKNLESGQATKYSTGQSYHSGVNYSYEFGGTVSDSLKYDPVKKKNVRKVRQKTDDYTWRQGVENLYKSKIFLAILGSLFLYKAVSVIMRKSDTEVSKQMEATYLRQRQKTRILEKQKKEEEEKIIEEYERKWGLRRSTSKS